MMNFLTVLENLRFHPPVLILFIPLFFVSFFTLLLISKAFSRRGILLSAEINIQKFKDFVLMSSYIVLINYIFLVGLYTISSNYVDHAESNIASVAWLFQTGHPLYPELESAARYINNYGPTLYLINGFFLNLLKPSILTSKLVGALAAFISVASIYYTLQKVSGFRTATVCCAYITLIFLTLNTFHSLPSATFWTRPDPLLLMCVSIALLGALRTPPIIAALLCTFFLGISLNLKLFAFLYFLPIYFILYKRAGIYYTLISILCSVAIAIGPFICFSQISLENYIAWFGKVSHQGLELSQFRRNLAWIIYLCIPLLMISLYIRVSRKWELNQFVNQNKGLIGILLFSVIAVTIIGSKPGALENNLLPLIPLLAYFSILVLDKARVVKEESSAMRGQANYLYLTGVSTTLALLISTLISVIPNEASLIKTLNIYPGAINDISGVVKSYPGTTIGMGYGQTYELSFYSPFLVFLNNPYLLDAASMMEMQQSGIDHIPPKTLAALASCQTKIWLIPKGEKPFNLTSYYFPNKPLFTDKFKTIFIEKYELQKSTNYYDLWFCKDKNLAATFHPLPVN